MIRLLRLIKAYRRTGWIPEECGATTGLVTPVLKKERQMTQYLRRN